MATSEHAAAVYLKGSGIEIGALNLPLRVPPSARVRYVDYLRSRRSDSITPTCSPRASR